MKLSHQGRFATHTIDEADIRRSGSAPRKDGSNNSPDGSSKRFCIFDVRGPNSDVGKAERAD
jgi:hypothetical protein